MQDAACGLQRVTGQHENHVRLSTFVAVLMSPATAPSACAVDCPAGAAASEAGSPSAAAIALSAQGAAPSAGAATGRRTGLRCACHSAAAASTCAGSPLHHQPLIGPQSSLARSRSTADLAFGARQTQRLRQHHASPALLRPSLRRAPAHRRSARAAADAVWAARGASGTGVWDTPKPSTPERACCMASSR